MRVVTVLELMVLMWETEMQSLLMLLLFVTERYEEPKSEVMCVCFKK